MLIALFLACTTSAVTADPAVDDLQKQVTALQGAVTALQEQLGATDTDQPDTTTTERLAALEAQAQAAEQELEDLGDAVSLLASSQPRIWTSVTLAPEAGQTEDWETVVTLDLDIEEEGTVWVQQRTWGDAIPGINPGVIFRVEDITSHDVQIGTSLDGFVYFDGMATFNAPLETIDIQARQLVIDELDVLVIFVPGV